MSDKVFFSSANTDCNDLGGGVSRQIMGYDDKIMLVKVKFEQGSVGAPHRHYHSQTSYVAEGRFEVTIGEQKQILKAGDSFYIPPDVIHGVVCMEQGILVDVFSPVREDFLDGPK
jgi:quercetin dioxygenase-like cupin family protein